MTLRPGLPSRGEGSVAKLFYAEPSMTHGERGAGVIL